MEKYDQYRQKSELAIPQAMQALVAKGAGSENLSVCRIPVPEIGPDQLLGRVDAAGVCTSVLKICEQGPRHSFINGWDIQKHPVILGDEGSVTIVKVGDNLKDKYKPGQRFAVQPAIDIAPILHRERYNDNAAGMEKCAVGYTLGGLLAQYIRIQEEVLQAGCLIPFPDGQMPYFAGSMAEPISCVVSAQGRNCHLVKKDSASRRELIAGFLPGGVTVVIGAGVMGRMHAELALRFRPETVLVCDIKTERLEKVKKAIGQKAKEKNVNLLCVTEDKLKERLAEVSNGRGADDVILAVGIRDVQQRAFSLPAKGGVINLFGGLAKDDSMLELDAVAVHYDEIKVVGSSGGGPGDMAETLKIISAGQIDPGNYVAAAGSLDNAIEVLKMIDQGQIDGRAILYPNIKQTPLQEVDCWDADKEKKFLDSRLP